MISKEFAIELAQKIVEGRVVKCEPCIAQVHNSQSNGVSESLEDGTGTSPFIFIGEVTIQHEGTDVDRTDIIFQYKSKRNNADLLQFNFRAINTDRAPVVFNTYTNSIVAGFTFVGWKLFVQ